MKGAVAAVDSSIFCVDPGRVIPLPDPPREP